MNVNEDHRLSIGSRDSHHVLIVILPSSCPSFRQPLPADAAILYFHLHHLISLAFATFSKCPVTFESSGGSIESRWS